ncbi:hypothetical protein [Plantactinospora sp. GCM10030261]
MFDLVGRPGGGRRVDRRPGAGCRVLEVVEEAVTRLQAFTS